MIRLTLAILAPLLVAYPALAQSSGSMGTGTSTSDPTGLQTSVPNAVHDQSSGGSRNAPPGQGSASSGSTNSGSTDTGVGTGNTTGAQTSVSSAIGNQTPTGSPPTH